MEHDYVLLLGVDPIKDGFEVIKRVVVPNHDENVLGSNTEGRGREILAGLQIELVEFGMDRAAPVRDSFRSRENGKEDECESNS